MNPTFTTPDDVLNPLTVERCIEISRRVAGWIGNRNAEVVEVMLVCHDPEEANAVLPTRLHLGPEITRSSGSRGACVHWNGTKRVIWINKDQSREQQVITLAHELAHAFTRVDVDHGAPWRAMYARLLPLIAYICGEKLDLTRCVESVVVRYTSDRSSYSSKTGMFVEAWERRDTECAELARKSWRAVKKFETLVRSWS